MKVIWMIILKIGVSGFEYFIMNEKKDIKIMIDFFF